MDDLLEYLEVRPRPLSQGDRGARRRAAGEASAFRAGELSVLEMHHYSARHVQHHAAQLNLLLRQGGVTPPRWVARGRGAR